MPKQEGDFHFYKCDILKRKLPTISGEIDKLVYCSGRINLKPFKGLKEKYFQADFDINVFGAIKYCKTRSKPFRYQRKYLWYVLVRLRLKWGWSPN